MFISSSVVKIPISGRRFVYGLTVTSTVLVVLSFLALYLRLYTSAPTTTAGGFFIYWFTTDAEGNVPTLFSGLLLITAAGLLALIALCKGTSGQPYRWHWWGLAFIFTYLACDEVGQLHERLSASLPQKLEQAGIQTPTWMHWAWVGPALLIVAVVGLAYLRMVLSLPRRTRLLIISSGALYVAGALGLEMVGGHLEATYGRGQEVLLTANFEEALEMYGITLFVYALIGHLRETTPHIQFDLPVAHSQSPTAPPSST